MTHSSRVEALLKSTSCCWKLLGLLTLLRSYPLHLQERTEHHPTTPPIVTTSAADSEQKNNSTRIGTTLNMIGKNLMGNLIGGGDMSLNNKPSQCRWLRINKIETCMKEKAAD
jgi:hypothetical protein